jgi:hypothetical protein
MSMSDEQKEDATVAGAGAVGGIAVSHFLLGGALAAVFGPLALPVAAIGGGAAAYTIWKKKHKNDGGDGGSKPSTPKFD